MTAPSDLIRQLKGKYSSLTIGFNEKHAANHVDAQGWHDEYGFYQGNKDDRITWVSEDERNKAIDNNTVWTIQRYPETPVGFSCVGASTFEASAQFAFSH